MSNVYDCRPSEVLGIKETIGDYEAYCFDEALCYIIAEIREGHEPSFSIKDTDGDRVRHYSSASDMYKDMGLTNKAKKRK